MEKFENFVDEYIEIAKEGIETIFQGVKNLCWIIFGSVLVVLLFPFWLVGKRERHLTQHALGAAIAFSELNAALENFVASLAALGKPPRQ
jgi:hypothetical protein